MRRSVAAVLRSIVAIAFVLGALPCAVASDDPVQMVVGLLAGADADERAIALDRVRHGLRGEPATAQFTSLLPKLAPPRQAEVIAALGDRGDPSALAAIRSLLGSSPDAAVRSACLRALGMLGGAADVPAIVKGLASPDPEGPAARRALVVVGGAGCGAAILAAASTGEPVTRAALLEILADRRERSTLPQLVTAAIDGNETVRAAAMRSLGRLGGSDEVPGMVQGVLKATPGKERDDAERALVTVCTAGRDSDRAAAAFLGLFTAAADADREILISPLGRIGGPGAMAIVNGLINDPNPAKRQFGLKAITRWPDATVSDRLLELLDKATDPAERELLLGALIRIAPLPDNKLNDQQKLDLLQKTMSLCQNDTDRARVLERANAIRTIETFRFVAPYLDNPALAEPACRSVVELAHHQKLRDANKDEFNQALDKVLATTKNAELVERAERYKQGKTWDRKKG
jgi:hypothetical protein